MPSRSSSSSQAAPPVASSRRHAPHVASLLAVLLVLAGAASRPAAAVEDMLTPRALGVGEALRGDATGALGPLLNPSGMALSKSYTIEAMYGFDVRSVGHDVHLSIVDSSTSKLAAGNDGQIHQLLFIVHISLPL